MSSEVDEFVQRASGVTAAKGKHRGEYIHDYYAQLDSEADPVRIRTLSPEIDDDTVFETFMQTVGEWQNASTHPNIVTVYERSETPRPWVAIDTVPGQTLEAARSNLSPVERKAIVEDAAEAVRNAALYNTAHSALSPECIRLDPDGERVSALVDDWGLQQAVRTAAGAVDVTPYTSPELLDDPTSADGRTDVYGLGAIAYYSLVGQPPVDGPDLEHAIRSGDISHPSEHDEDLPTAVDEVVLKALSTDPSDRYESAYHFKTAFGRAYDPDGSNPADSPENGPTSETSDADDTQDVGSENESSVPTRRTVLGVLGVGAVGIGGGLVVTRRSGEDSSGSTTGAISGEVSTETPPTVDTSGTGASTENPDSTPTDWRIEGFEESSLDPWEGTDNAQITTSRAHSGARSVVVTDDSGYQDDGIGNTISLPITPSTPSRVRGALLIDDGDWNTVAYKLKDSSGEDIHNFRIHHQERSVQKSLYYNGRQITLRDEVSPFEWYYVELLGIDWEANTIGLIQVNDDVAATDVAFSNDGERVAEIALRVHDGGVGSKGYFDDISIGQVRY